MRLAEIARIVIPLTVALILSEGAARAQPERLSELESHLKGARGRVSESLSRLPEAGWVLAPPGHSASGRIAKQTKSATTCRRGRRALLGALIGTTAAAPLAALAHKRWTNEAANGAGAAATTLALGAAGGGFIGLATCGS